MDKQKKNFYYWRDLVGLPEEFPSLLEIQAEDLEAFFVTRPEQLQEVKNSLSNQYNTMVIFQPGWGASSFYQYFDRIKRKEMVNELIIPVRIDFAEEENKVVWNAERLEEIIKYEIFLQLIDREWRSKLNRDYYFDMINYDSETDFLTYRNKTLKKMRIERMVVDNLCKLFPYAKQKSDTLLNMLLKDLRIQVQLFFHYPRNLDEGVLLSFISSLKHFYEYSQFEKAAIRELHCCSTLIANALDRDYRRNYRRIKVTPYSAAEIYKMFVKRYNPRLEGYKGRKVADLDSVFSEQYITQAWNERDTISTIVQSVKNKILEQMDCEKNQIPFKLDPGVSNFCELRSGKTKTKERKTVETDATRQQYQHAMDEPQESESDEKPVVRKRFRRKR